MNILQINAVYKRLSTGVNVYEMNRTLAQQGHHCVAAYSVGKLENTETEYRIGSVAGQKLHALLSRISGMQGYFSSFSTRKLLRFMDQFQPDVVVLNNLHANYIHLPILLKYLAEKDIPTVAVLHDCWFYTGKCCFYTLSGCQKWKHGCGNCPAVKAYNKSWFFDRSQKMLEDRKRLFGAIPRLGVVAVSDWLLNEARQSPVFSNAKYFQRIYNWIDTDVFTCVPTQALREKLGLTGKKVLLAAAAMWEPRKGLDALVWISEQLHPDEQLVLIGKLPADRELPDQILHIPATYNRQELVEYYSMADVFIQPSLEETFGKVTAEAISCGTPVVCFDSTANPELVGENCGAVVTVGDWQAMLQEARGILNTGKQYFSATCRDFARKHFELKNNVAQYLELFQSLQKPQSKKTILQINAVYKRLSTGRNVYEMNRAFAEQGHYAVAAYSVGSIEDPNTEYLIGKKPGQKLHAFLSRAVGLQGYFSSFSTGRLIRYIKDLKPDVVLLHNLHANYIHLPMLLKYLAKKDIATVAVLHDCWFYTGKCCHYTVAGCYRWQKSCGNCPAKKRYNKSWLFDRSAKMLADKKKYFQAIPRLGVVAVSQWLLREAQKAPVFERAQELLSIHNWIDTQQFKPVDGSTIRKELGLENKKIILGVAGSWDNSKGLDTALKLAQKLTDQEQLVLVGRLADGVVLPKNVTHIPRTDNVDKLTELYSAADVFLQPSLEETFGKVSAEALACGTPVVCFNSTANPELIGEGCGTVVEPGDMDGLLLAIRTHLQQEKAVYSDRCRAFAVEKFNTEKNISAYMDLINRLTAIKTGEKIYE